MVICEGDTCPKQHFGVAINHRAFYSFTDGFYYFSLFDNRKGKRYDIWQRCPYEDPYNQVRFIFCCLLNPYMKYCGCSIAEISINIDTNEMETLDEWEIDDINEYHWASRTEVIQKEFEEKIKMLRGKYAPTPFVPAA